MKNIETCASVKDNIRNVFSLSYIHGSQGKMEQKNSNRKLRVVRTTLWIWKVIWEDSVDCNKHVYEYLRKRMEERNKKADFKYFPHL